MRNDHGAMTRGRLVRRIALGHSWGARYAVAYAQQQLFCDKRPLDRVGLTWPLGLPTPDYAPQLPPVLPTYLSGSISSR